MRSTNCWPKNKPPDQPWWKSSKPMCRPVRRATSCSMNWLHYCPPAKSTSTSPTATEYCASKETRSFQRTCSNCLPDWDSIVSCWKNNRCQRRHREFCAAVLWKNAPPLSPGRKKPCEKRKSIRPVQSSPADLAGKPPVKRRDVPASNSLQKSPQQRHPLPEVQFGHRSGNCPSVVLLLSPPVWASHFQERGHDPGVGVWQY